jgi:hypothetical protein
LELRAQRLYLAWRARVIGHISSIVCRLQAYSP